MLTTINLNPRNVMGIYVFLLGVVCLTFITVAWKWHSDWALVHQVFTKPIIEQSNPTAELIAAIPEDHLFGKSFAEGGDMPISNLQFRVTGIVKIMEQIPASAGTSAVGAGTSAQPSKAYISIAGQPAKIYQVGDALPYGVKVYQITNDAVILANDSHLEKLPLPRDPLNFKPKNTPIEETNDSN